MMKLRVCGCYWSIDQFRNRGIKILPPEPQSRENLSLTRLKAFPNYRK